VENRWYLSTWFIATLFSFWFLIIPLIMGIILLNKQKQENSNHKLLLQEREQNLEQEKILLAQKEINLYELFKKKEKEILLRTFTQQLKIISFSKSKREEILTLNKNFEEKMLKKEKEISIKILIDQLKLYSILKLKSDELKNLELAITERKERLKEVFGKKHKEIISLTEKINTLKKDLTDLEDDSLYQTFGIYKNRYTFEKSEEYKNKLEKIKDRQKKLVSEKKATIHSENWSLNGSLRKGRANNNLNIKIAIRSFNHECEHIISKVKFNNVDVAEKKIQNEFNSINRLNKYNEISISPEYRSLKFAELYLAYEFAQKKQEEIEEQKRIRDLLREEVRAQKELEEELKKIKKEESHLLNVLSERTTKISEFEKQQCVIRLTEIRRQIEEVDYRVNNTKAGYVYIISNIGCFGENIYKIGMTRRLEPLERVRELGGASVPFHFDVHAIIFSEDAPGLEASLHRAFNHRRVNRINLRKEFFNVNLAEIKKVVNQTHKKDVEFRIIAEAKEYRETKALEEKVAKQHII